MDNILENFRKHLGHSVLLLLFLSFGVTLFLAFSHDSVMRIIMLVLVSLCYALWGVVHHYVRKDLSWGLAIEYITIAFLAGVGVLSILGWGTL
ncbi:MAG: hypothetical protein M3P33_03670 [bacterium]|nr:hypothetical protein [bacterium]